MIEPRHDAQPLPAKQAQLIRRLATVLGRDEFVMFGGAALDLLLGPPRPAKDLDVAVPLVPATVRPSLEHLHSGGCLPQGPVREYWINLDQPVLMVDVRWGEYVIDLNFVDEIERIPQFDIEGVIWRFPECDFIDLYGAFSALERSTVRPVHGLDKNNPYLLMNRMIRLAAKYGLQLADNPAHQELVSGLSERIAAWSATDDFQGRQALEAHHRSVASSVLRSVDPHRYLVDLARAGAIQQSVPELHRLLTVSAESVELLARVRDPGSFWPEACALMAPDDGQALMSRVTAAAIPPQAAKPLIEESE